MNRRLSLLLLPALVCVSSAQKPDMSQMPADAHAPLFRQKTPQAGKLTDRVASVLPEQPGDATPIPHRNFIDDEIFGAMKRDGIPHAPLATDTEFIRRAKLDIAGRIPSPAEVRTFLGDKSPDKREKLI
ncbi:MAG: hypothetical protein QOJ99_3361, partial [Bryobacterales bacterium]|nr:hypothetical protein [Bryobacterales bacterium]